MEIQRNEEDYNRQSTFLIEKENVEWLKLVWYAMQSGASKEEFLAFLVDEAKKQGIHP